LLWLIQPFNTPPLVTIGPPKTVAILGRSGTIPVFNGFDNNRLQPGGSFTLGAWLDDALAVGIEGGFFFLTTQNDSFILSSPANATVARPFINATTGAEDSQLVSVPGQLNGTVVVSQWSRLDGAELNGVFNVLNRPVVRLDTLVGLRYLDLDERLSVAEHLQVDPSVPVTGGQRFDVLDRFRTADRFLGGQLGARGALTWGLLSLTTTAKVALGCTEEVAGVKGGTVFTPVGGIGVLQNGGLLALPSNTGRFARDVFAVVPEVGVNLALQLAPWLRLRVGYTWLYWSDVARPGGVIDRVVSPAQVPTGGGPGGVGSRPAFAFHGTDFVAQGVNIGVEIRY
jgi:hypothetical protein